MSLPVASEVDIANYALRLIGDQPITDMTDNSDRGRFMNSTYALTRDSVLRAHPWNFATYRATLATATITQTVGGVVVTKFPAFEFTQAYALPNGAGTDPVLDPFYCLRVLYTSFDSPDRWDGLGIHANTWRVEGRFLVTNAAIATASTPPLQVFIIYIGRTLDVTVYDPLFVTALAARLAAQASLPLKGDKKLMDMAWSMYATSLQEARSINGMEGTQPQWSDTTLADVR